MRLINTETFELEEFFGDKIPPYAILSHTWGDDEVTFQQWNAWDEGIQQRTGFKKIEGACAQARSDELDWVWVDTNCIDKTSSAELSEAINSMYAWYRGSRACYAYLADVPALERNSDGTFPHFEQLQQFRNSRWFTRGWTLQELLAPRYLMFFSYSWTIIGSKKDPEVIEAVSDITGIEKGFLKNPFRLEHACVAQKMCWLSNRRTTRVEDLAYCMLGIFDIHMPLLYGEGERAFTRLQEEIIKTSNDHTIFCWTQNDILWRGSILAESPDAFAESGHYRRCDSALCDPAPYSVTNIGLSIRLPLYLCINRTFARLDARSNTSKDDRPVFIPLERGNDRSTILERSKFPDRPVCLAIDEVDQTPRDVFVAIRGIWRPYSSYAPRHPSHGVLLIFSHSQQWFQDVSADEERSGLSCKVLSHPLRAFHSSTSTLWLTEPASPTWSPGRWPWGALVLLLRGGRIHPLNLGRSVP